MSLKFPCPCCGHLTLSEGPGDYEICPVCSWEDDLPSLHFPLDYMEGPNGISLAEGQERFERTGVIYEDQWQDIRPAREDEPIDPGWHLIRDSVGRFERSSNPSSRYAPKDRTSLYWWRPNYWLH